MFAPLSSCTSAAPSTIIFINYSGYFPCSPLAASLVSDHIPWKCGIWKHEDYYINIHGILTSNVFLVIFIHIRNCGSDFWKNLLLFSPSNRPLTASLASDHIPWKCGIWKHEDYHINIHSILTSNIFLIISIHIQSCGSDFWKYLLFFHLQTAPNLQDCSHSHNLPTFPESTLLLII